MGREMERRKSNSRFKVIPVNEIFRNVLDGVVEEEGVAMPVDGEVFSIVEADFVDFVSERESFRVFGDGLEVLAAKGERKDQKQVSEGKAKV